MVGGMQNLQKPGKTAMSRCVSTLYSADRRIGQKTRVLEVCEGSNFIGFIDDLYIFMNSLMTQIDWLYLRWLNQLLNLSAS